MRKFIGLKNPLLSAHIAYFVFLHWMAKNKAAKFKGRACCCKDFPLAYIIYSNQGLIKTFGGNSRYLNSAGQAWCPSRMQAKKDSTRLIYVRLKPTG